MNRSLRLLVIVCSGLAAACATTARGHRASCDLAASDSVFAGSRPVFRDCSVDRAARLLGTGNVRPDFRPPEMRTACYSADLKFVVDSTGKPEPSTAKLLRATNREFGEAVLATLWSWKYEPAIRNGVPVRQIVTRHQTLSTAVVVVPAGSPPPAHPPEHLPRC